MPNPAAQYLTPEQVAHHCGVPLQTVTGWLQRGHLSHSQQGTQASVSADELVQFMHQNHLAIPAELMTPPETLAPQRAPKVLVVDEDKPMATMIARVLRQMDLEVIQANNGFDASVTYIQRKPNLMTLDLGLSGMGGVELIENIKATQTHKAKILVITNSMPSLLARAKSAGADAILTKPFDNDSLRRAVRILLQL